jgi:serine/threonine-protein kinase RsbW
LTDRGVPTSETAKSVLLEISSTFEMLKVVDLVSEQFAHIAGLDEDGAHCLGVAVREAVANAMKHGNRNDVGKRTRVEYAARVDLTQTQVVVRVRDEGSGFDVTGVPDPRAPENISVSSGRGIFLMRALMDDVQVHPLPAGGTEIVLAKAINRKMPGD